MPPRDRAARDHRLLRRSVGRGDPAAPPVLVRGGAADDREDAVARRLGHGQALEHDDAAAFAAHEAVGPRVEGLAATVGRHHAGPRQRDGRLRRAQHVDPAGQGHAALAAPEALAREVNGHQRRGAGRVHRDGRAVQAEDIGHSTRDHARCVTRGAVGVDRVGPEPAQVLVVVGVAGADEHPGGAPPEGIGRLAGVFEGLPGHFQQQSLLGIHALRLARRDAEDIRVETIDLRQEAAVARGETARRVGIRIEEGRRVPAIGRRFPDRVDPATQQLPERLRTIGPSRESAGHPDDRDRLLAKGLGRLELLLQLEGEEGQALRRHLLDAFGEIAHRQRPRPILCESKRSTSSSERSSTDCRTPTALGSASGAFSRRSAPAQGLGAHEGHESVHGRVVEQHGGRQGSSDRPPQSIAQLHRHEGIEAQLLEGPLRIDVLGVGETEHLARFRAHARAEQILPVRGRRLGELGAQVGCGRGSGFLGSLWTVARPRSGSAGPGPPDSARAAASSRPGPRRPGPRTARAGCREERDHPGGRFRPPLAGPLALLSACGRPRPRPPRLPS